MPDSDSTSTHAIKVGLLTSWNTPCGIAEYSKMLVEAYQRRGDVELVVFGSRNYGERKVREDEDFVVPTFTVEPWYGHGSNDFDIEAILAAQLDVLHIQYVRTFYDARKLRELIERHAEGLVVITYQDNDVDDLLPHDMLDARYTHRHGVGRGEVEIIPYGIESRRPVVKTFGLGRCRWDLIKAVCESKGWDFQRSFASDQWFEHEELNQWLRDSDAICLWYDDNLSAGSSSAARQALSTGRPVVVNDVTWFAEMPQQTHNFYKVSDTHQLASTLEKLLRNPYVEQSSWDLVAGLHVNAYQRMLAKKRT